MISVKECPMSSDWDGKDRRKIRGLRESDKAVLKQAMQEALREWMDDKYRCFGE